MCVCCGRSPAQLLATYCSARCAIQQLAALRMLLNTTPRRALSVAEWHDLGQSFETDVELLGAPSPEQCGNNAVPARSVR